jgi:hypothetical protein
VVPNTTCSNLQHECEKEGTQQKWEQYLMYRVNTTLCSMHTDVRLTSIHALSSTLSDFVYTSSVAPQVSSYIPPSVRFEASRDVIKKRYLLRSHLLSLYPLSLMAVFFICSFPLNFWFIK